MILRSSSITHWSRGEGGGSEAEVSNGYSPAKKKGRLTTNTEWGTRDRDRGAAAVSLGSEIRQYVLIEPPQPDPEYEEEVERSTLRGE